MIFLDTHKKTASCEIIGLSKSTINSQVFGEYINATTIFNAINKNATSWKKNKETVKLFKTLKKPTETRCGGKHLFIHKNLLSNLISWCHQSIINKTNLKPKPKPKPKTKVIIETYNDILQSIKNSCFISIQNNNINCYLPKDVVSIIYDFLYDADEGVFITQTRALKEYKIKLKNLLALPFKEVRNPHYKCAAPMKLFDKSLVRKLSQTSGSGLG
jgi:hypothetical protein